MKTENARLLQSIADFKFKGDMAKETVQNLSSVIRDKDLEIDGLKSRNESLVTLVQESSKQIPNGKNFLNFSDILLTSFYGNLLKK